MNRWILCLLCAAGIGSFARRCPAPIIFRPGEGWTYEPVGQTGRWERNRAKDQLQVAQDAFKKQDYGTTLKAARRVVKVWPLADDYAGPAQFLLGRVYEARGMDEKAFKEYQHALLKYPRLPNYGEVVQRQLIIANRFLGGQWFKLWGYVPFFPSMDKTAALFGTVAQNGPYHPTGPIAQMSIGTAREKQRDYPLAVKAYEKAADRYYDRPEVASEALYRAGLAWNRQAKRAEYDQSASAKSIDTMNDFKALYPNDKRVPDATAIILDLKTEQARGAFETAQFYEHYRRYQGAIVYYSEVVAKDPNSPFAARAKERVEALKPLADQQMKKFADAEKKRMETTRAAAGTKPGGLTQSKTNAPTATPPPAGNPK